MKRVFTISCIVAVLYGCNQSEPSSTGDSLQLPTFPAQEINLVAQMRTEDLLGLQWMHTPDEFKISNGILHVVAQKGTDFFNNPETGEVIASAPVLYRELSSDFVATALVKPDFSDVWNAVSLMVHIDSANWIKFAFENSDATGKSIVSVVTRGVSDDANGAVLNDQDSAWLRIIRKGNNYAMHWSSDGQKYYMARLATLPAATSVKIGIEAQCPAGGPASHEIKYFSLEERTVGDLRNGK